METIAICGAILLGSVVNATTGLGFVVVIAPVLIHLMSPVQMVVMGHVLGLIPSLGVVLAAHRFVDRLGIVVMIGAAVAGLPFGLVVLTTASVAQMKLLVGSLTALAAVLLLLGVSVAVRRPALHSAVAGFLGGVLSTSTGLAGIPPGIVMLNGRAEKHAVRANVAVYLVAISSLSVGMLLTSHAARVGELLSTLPFVPIALLGTFIGNALANRMSPAVFRSLTIALVGLAGAATIVVGLAALL